MTPAAVASAVRPSPIITAPQHNITSLIRCLQDHLSPRPAISTPTSSTRPTPGCIPSTPLFLFFSVFFPAQLGEWSAVYRLSELSSHRFANPRSGEKLAVLATMLYRTTAARSALRALSNTNASVARSSLAGNVFKAPLTSAARFPARPTSSPTLALAARKPVTTALVRYASSSSKVSETERHERQEP